MATETDRPSRMRWVSGRRWAVLAAVAVAVVAGAVAITSARAPGVSAPAATTPVAAAPAEPATSGPVSSAQASSAPAPSATSVSPTPSKTTAAPTRTKAGTTAPKSSTRWPTPTESVKVGATIVVSGTRDLGMRRYFGVGDGGQGESQDPMFELADGAVLKNVILGAPAGDGVHCKGSCRLINVWWEDVGEDAATFRGGAGSAFLVDGGGARSASDKVFQHNGGGTLTIRDFQVSDFGKLYRSCGNCSTQYKRSVVIENVRVTAPGKTLAGINVNYGDTAKLTNVTIVGDSGKQIGLCDLFKGNSSGDEPTKIGSGPDGSHCTASGVTYR